MSIGPTGASVPPTTADELRERLRQGPIRFAFRKKDGTLRLAYGTLDLNKVPQENQPKGERQSSPKVIPFFDLDKFEWRSVSVDQLIFG
jgi:hypothetical protein